MPDARYDELVAKYTAGELATMLARQERQTDITTKQAWDAERTLREIRDNKYTEVGARGAARRCLDRLRQMEKGQ